MTPEPRRSEPVSWLLLERYHLGELPPAQAREIERAIAEDDATRKCFELIQKPVALPPLQRAPERPLQLNPQPEPPGRLRRIRNLVLSPWPVAAMALAAAFVLYVAAGREEASDELPAATLRLKGGDVALELVRERAGVVSSEPTTFEDGDRFKVMLTCPPGMREPFDVVVFQGSEAFRPLSPLPAIPCGNSVALPGAFTLTGDVPSTVCVVWGRAAEGNVAESGGVSSLRGSAVCTTLSAE